MKVTPAIAEYFTDFFVAIMCCTPEGCWALLHTVNPYGEGTKVVFDDGGNQISLDTCAEELFDYWQQLLQKLTGKPYRSVGN